MLGIGKDNKDVELYNKEAENTEAKLKEEIDRLEAENRKIKVDIMKAEEALEDKIELLKIARKDKKELEEELEELKLMFKDSNKALFMERKDTLEFKLMLAKQMQEAFNDGSIPPNVTEITSEQNKAQIQKLKDDIKLNNLMLKYTDGISTNIQDIRTPEQRQERAEEINGILDLMFKR